MEHMASFRMGCQGLCVTINDCGVARTTEIEAQLSSDKS
jgi:hypothetical protein